MYVLFTWRDRSFLNTELFAVIIVQRGIIVQTHGESSSRVLEVLKMLIFRYFLSGSGHRTAYWRRRTPWKAREILIRPRSIRKTRKLVIRLKYRESRRGSRSKSMNPRRALRARRRREIFEFEHWNASLIPDLDGN